MANRDFGGGRGWQGRDYERDYDRDRGYDRDREYDRGYEARYGRDYQRDFRDRDFRDREFRDRDVGREFDGRDDRGWRGRPQYSSESNVAWQGQRDWNDNRDYRSGSQYGSGRGSDWGGRDWQREQWDMGDRNPSQGFTGGYGGAFGRSYAEAGDRMNGPAGSGGYGSGQSREWSGWSGDVSRDASRSFAGRGPRNYRRSDQRLEEEVNEALMRHHEIDASDVEVRVENGEVTLSGEVEDRRAKRLAEDVAEQVMGVRDVHNHLKARRGFWDSVLGGGGDEADRDRERNREQNRQLNEKAAASTGRTTTASTTTTTRNGTATQTTGAGSRG
jgi:hypothetical protein